MKIYIYNDIGEMGRSVGTQSEISEKEIIEIYFGLWKDMIAKKKIEDPSFPCEETEENCIKDWVAVNWAWEKK